jgi:hypothetical protein
MSRGKKLRRTFTTFDRNFDIRGSVHWGKMLILKSGELWQHSICSKDEKDYGGRKLERFGRSQGLTDAS